MADDDVTVWFNAKCSKCRGADELLRERGIDATYVKYLEDTPSRAELERVDNLLVTAESVTATVDSASRLAYLAHQQNVCERNPFSASACGASFFLERFRHAGA